VIFCSQSAFARSAVGRCKWAGGTDPDEDVRQSAYKAMLILNGVSDEQHVKLLNERAMTIDISWVEAMLKE